MAKLFVKGSRDPETDLARALLAQGITGMVMVLDANTGKHRPTVDIERAAKLRIVETGTSPRYRSAETCAEPPHAGETDPLAPPHCPKPPNRGLPMKDQSPLAPKQSFNEWLRSAKAGSIFIYCTAANLGDKGVTDEERATAEQARDAFANGLIELCQRKCRAGYDYLAIKRRDEQPPLVHGVPWVPKISKPGYAR